MRGLQILLACGMDRYEVPELAVAAVERVHGLTVTVHDDSGLIERHFRHDRSAHRHWRCQAVKARDRSRACVAFDQDSLTALLAGHPDGLVQRCPFGLGEAVVPLHLAGRPAGVLFAGPFAVADSAGLTRDAGNEAARLPRLDAGQVEALLECLRQLAARLALWVAEGGEDVQAPGASRRARILGFIERHFRESITIAGLANELALSPGRATHVVRATCGASFVTLLTTARLDHAANLLRHSSCDITTVALASGFGDTAHFHRLFRRRFATTPMRYRLSASA